VPFDHIDLADQYLVVFAGAGHDAFVADSGSGSPVWAATQQVTLAFWDAYLRASEQARAWLCDGGCAAALQSWARFEHKPARRPGGDPISRPEERP
jgi:hypothetical protein